MDLSQSDVLQLIVRGGFGAGTALIGAAIFSQRERIGRWIEARTAKIHEKDLKRTEKFVEAVNGHLSEDLAERLSERLMGSLAFERFVESVALKVVRSKEAETVTDQRIAHKKANEDNTHLLYVERLGELRDDFEEHVSHSAEKAIELARDITRLQTEQVHIMKRLDEALEQWREEGQKDRDQLAKMHADGLSQIVRAIKEKK